MVHYDHHDLPKCFIATETAQGQRTLSLAVWHTQQGHAGTHRPTLDCLFPIQSPCPVLQAALPTSAQPRRAEKLPCLLGGVPLQAPANASLFSRQFISTARAQKVLVQGGELGRGVPTGPTQMPTQSTVGQTRSASSLNVTLKRPAS